MKSLAPLFAVLLSPMVAFGAGPEAFPGLSAEAFQPLGANAVRLDGNHLRLRTSAGDLEMDIRDMRRHPNGDLSLTTTDPESGRHGHFTLGAGGAFGTLAGPGGQRLLTTDRDGTWLIELPRRGVSFNLCGMDHEKRPARDLPADPNRPEANTATVIDLLLVYNDAFAARYPGEVLDTRLNHLVEIANRTMGNSGLDIGFRLAGSARVPYTNDNSNRAFRDDLSAALAGEARPGLASLAALRDTTGADLVIGLRPHDIDVRGSCGIAFFPGDDDTLGVNVVSDGSSSWSFCLDDVLTHEIGHNLGATHQFGAGGGFTDPRGSAFVREGRFTTVMASFGTGRTDRFRGLEVFSTPALPCGNEPCGDPADTDNATVIRRFAGQVADYRPAPDGPDAPQRWTRGAPDQDGDGVTDWLDALPFDAAERFDADGDGTGDNRDAFPDDPLETRDTDDDGVGDNADPDDDGDGVPDPLDAFPRDARETADTDGDGVGDSTDVFRADAREWRDRDGDGTGDNADPDQDGDGVPERDTRAWDLLVVSAGNGRILRFDAASGASRGVEVPPWDSLITFQSALAWRPDEDTLVYTGDSGLRRLDLRNRALLGEWVPPFAEAGSATTQLGSGFPLGLTVLGDGERLLVSRFRDPALAAFTGRERPRPEFGTAWRLDEEDLPGDITADGDTAYAVGAANGALYALTATQTRVLAGPAAPWLGEPTRLAVPGDGRLLVSDRARNAVLAVDADSGELIGELARLGPVGFDGPEGLAVTPDGELLVAAAGQNAVLAFDATTGEFRGPRVPRGAGGLDQPGDLVLVPALRDRFPDDPDRQFRPNPGLWYDPASDGRGFDIQYFGTRLSVTWYTYDDAGLPTWYFAADDLSDMRFEADLFRYTLPTEGTLTGSIVGGVELDFTSERRATVRWNVAGNRGEEALQWFEFTTSVVREDATGLWGREDGPGWGVSLASQGGVTVAVAFVYDAEGQPRWVISEPATGSPPWTFDMGATFSSGLCPACDGTPGAAFVPAGVMTIDVAGPGRWDSEVTFPAPLAGDWRLEEVPLRRFSLPSVRPR